MTRPKLAPDLALVQLLRESLPRWLTAADFGADAADFDKLPAPLTDYTCCRWADEIVKRHDERYKILGLRLGILAETPDGKAVTKAARTIPDLTGDRALFDLVTAQYEIGAPPWWAAVAAVETIATLAERVGLESLNAALAEKARDPVRAAVRVGEGIAHFRGQAAATILDRAKASRPDSAPSAAL